MRPEEIGSAVEIHQCVTERPDTLYLVAPELVPGEYADHADRLEAELGGWLQFHDQNQEWLTATADWLAIAIPAFVPVRPLGIQKSCRELADNLLAKAEVLARDQACLDRAVGRLIAKRRPSHNKEIKDSMNLEQTLELSRRLQHAGFACARVFVSSNTNDFASTAPGATIHPDLQAEFAATGLEYFTSFRSAVGSLRARGQLP
ncbi:MAG TPA: hypothetical protein VF278_22240 [Pirellulales bacterium]